ncbi:putative neutral ceramidase C [Styela clava]
MVKEEMEDGCHSIEIVSDAKHHCKSGDETCSESETNIVYEVSESSSLLNEAGNEDTVSRSSTSFDNNVESDYEDHPLRALSCASIAAVESIYESEVTASENGNAEVYIPVPSPDVIFKNIPSRSKRNRVNNTNTGCIPLSAIFRSEFGPHESAHHGEMEDSSFGYKNWLMHLGRRRRCEILILIGFLMWLAFFIVLAIVLNGNSSKTNEDVDPEWLDKALNNGNGQNLSAIFLAKDMSLFPMNTTLSSNNTTANQSFTLIMPSSRAFNSDVTNKDKETGEDGKKSEIVKSEYLIGVGRADMTGPAADVNLMGYAKSTQRAGGIHLRQYARAFIVEDRKTKVRTAFINIDACMASTLVKLEVLKALKSLYGNLYTAENLCISGTHTHSAPAGFLQDVLFQVTSWGYVDETLVAMVNGIVKSIQRAHNSTQPGYILMNMGELVGSSINRSPMAYLNNPEEEKAKYKHDVDTEMTLLKFMNEKDQAIGMINWFPVHCTSMNNTNTLISGDNKGYAEQLFEKYMNPEALPGRGNFVAAFAQSNEGDVSPNTKGPHCVDTGKACDNIHSTCNGQVQNCIASGPGKDMFESTKIIGNNQFKKAKELFENAKDVVTGPVKFIHQYVDMTKYEVVLNSTTKVRTCKPAMGFSFAAGTTDGPGGFDFKQGDTAGNKFWHTVRNFLHSPSPEQIRCHAPKPILLDTGEMKSPYDWQPEIVDTQIFQIGQLLILALPGEFSTMTGRRLQNGVIETLKEIDPKSKYTAVIAGLANTYSDYITTFEEYQVQRYEGASTIYGPYTARAYIQQYQKLAKSLAKNAPIKSNCHPTNLKSKLLQFQTPVIVDMSYLSSFGDVIENTKDNYTIGEEVSVSFVAGNPRSSLVARQDNNTFLLVQKRQHNGSWKTIHTDADWETKFIWKRTSTMYATSEVTILWATDETTSPGIYRICHHGFYKSLLYGIQEYSGQSRTFIVS